MSESEDALDDRLLAEGRFAEVLARHLPALRGRARAQLKSNSPDLADDVVQEVALRVWREYEAGKVWGYPVRVILHKRLSWTLLDHFDGKPDEVPFPEDFDPRDIVDSVSDLGDREYVGEILDTLPPREREVARLRILEDRTPAEIATAIGIEPNAVHQALFRAWGRLREMLDG